MSHWKTVSTDYDQRSENIRLFLRIMFLKIISGNMTEFPKLSKVWNYCFNPSFYQQIIPIYKGILKPMIFLVCILFWGQEECFFLKDKVVFTIFMIILRYKVFWRIFDRKSNEKIRVFVWFTVYFIFLYE